MGVTTETGKGRIESEELVTDARAHRQNQSQKRRGADPNAVAVCTIERKLQSNQAKALRPRPHQSTHRPSILSLLFI